MPTTIDLTRSAQYSELWCEVAEAGAAPARPPVSVGWISGRSQGVANRDASFERPSHTSVDAAGEPDRDVTRLLSPL
jgi:hypothetical protein